MKERKGYVFAQGGKWYARITLTDATGKRRNVKRTANSKPAAKTLLKQLCLQLETEGIEAIDSLQRTFSDLADHYRDNYAIPAKILENQRVEGMRDFQRVRGFVERFRIFFGSRKLREITHGDISKYRSHRLQIETQYKRQRSITTINRELSCLRRMFNIALQCGWVVKNPFNCGDTLIQTFYERRRERILTLAEETLLLEACDDPIRSHLKPLLIALLDTGARKGEMLKLQWSDVDLDKRIITIRAQNTKTLRERQVGITERLYRSLTELWNDSDGQLSSVVFGIASNVRRSFASACKIAGIKHGGLDGLTLHCLRHSAATRLVKGQLPIQMVGRLLGHTQINTTYRYLSADNDTAKQAATILESFQMPTLESVPVYIN